MAAQWKHKRYFRVRGVDSSCYTFSSVSDANTKVGFTSVYDTNSPTKTEVLEDSGQTLVVTYEFSSEAEQTAFKDAIDGAWTASSTPYDNSNESDMVEHFKTEWLHQDGTVSSTNNL
jgi:hypothetical protein